MTLYARVRRATADELAEWAVLTTVLAIAAVASYIHLREVWLHTRAPIPELGPLLVDGLFAAAWLRMRRRRRERVRVGWLAWAALTLALAATVAGNIAAAWIAGQRDPLSLIVAAWPALAFALVWELVTGSGRHRPPATVVGEVLEDGRTVVEEMEDGTLVLDSGDGVTPEPWECQRDRLLREGAGRKVLAAELGISEWEARQLIAEHRQGLQEAPA